MTGRRIEPVSIDRDLDGITAIARASFARPWSREMFARELSAQPLSRGYVLRADDRVVAFCACWLVMDELHINTIAVEPALRRRGLARELLDHVLREARAQGAKRAFLEVRASNVAAIRLYEAFAFTRAAVRKGYYPDPPEDALLLSREL